MTEGFDYQRYLASREWALLKEQVRHRSGGKCERCPTGDYKQTHHLTYERVGHERLDDLLGICRECHEFLSGKSHDDPRTAHLIAKCLTNDGAWAGEWIVACPVCAFDYSHIAGVFTRRGADPYEAGDYRGAPPLGSSDERRSSLVIVFEGECEHIWEIEIQQHKGNNILRAKPLGELPDGLPRWNPEPEEVESEQPQRAPNPRQRRRDEPIGPRPLLGQPRHS